MAMVAKAPRWINHLKQFTVMRKIFIALAAIAAAVGCSKENAPMEVIEHDSFMMNASIVLDDTRVTVEGEKFTDVKWVKGDNVALSSAAGASATLVAEAAGDTSVRFVGEGVAVADADTYYAIYPKMEIVDGVAMVDLMEQSGDDAAVLVSKAQGNRGEAIDMTFRPANALLHVAVSGVESLAKAEFMAFNEASLPQGFAYLFESEMTQNYGEVASYTIDNPSLDGFFFSLPADLDMSAGYVVRLTDAQGNICSKAYNGKIFTKATTTRVAIEWSTPSVTLGAKTSYSYYLLNQPASANSSANDVIYFSGDCASSYAGIQNAYISEVGFKVDGTTYSSASGNVVWNKSEKSFSMDNLTVSEKRGYTVEAYIVTKEHGTITSSNTLYITGLPYTLNVSANDGTWTEEREVKWGNTDRSYSAVRIGYAVGSSFNTGASSMTKSFTLPADVNVNVKASGEARGSRFITNISTTASIAVSGSIIGSQAASGKNTYKSFNWDVNKTMSASNATIKCNNSNSTNEACTYLGSLFIGYANK